MSTAIQKLLTAIARIDQRITALDVKISEAVKVLTPDNVLEIQLGLPLDLPIPPKENVVASSGVVKPRPPFVPVPRDISKRRQKARAKSPLPNSSLRDLMDESKLKESTKKSYQTCLMHIENNAEDFRKVIHLRNSGMTSKEVAETMGSQSRFNTHKRIECAISVARRVDFIDRTSDRKIVFTILGRDRLGHDDEK